MGKERTARKRSRNKERPTQVLEELYGFMTSRLQFYENSLKPSLKINNLEGYIALEHLDYNCIKYYCNQLFKSSKLETTLLLFCTF